ncbi:MAG TPA: acetyl-CoA carboxylase carboxyltransferase subunit beta, partial [Candidatus Limnocylindrales bacterium]
PDRIAAAQLATGMRDAAVWGMATIDGRPVAICVMDFGFMGGSMGAVVGEKVTRAAEYALESRTPLIIVSASGGARMQEGTLALMQLAKTVAAIERLRMAGVPFVSILTDPTTGGVFASFAVLGDVNIAEPDAMIGFAGARVSAGTIAQELPEGFQRSEFLYAHGFLDRVVHRTELRAEIAGLLAFLVARPLPATEEAAAADVLSLPSFRPLSFLTNLAERVMQIEPEPTVPTNGNGTGAARPTQPPLARAVNKPEAETIAAVEPDEATAVTPDGTAGAEETPTTESAAAAELADPMEPAEQLEPVEPLEPTATATTEETRRG